MSLPQTVDLEALINGDSATVVLDIVDAADGTTAYLLTGWIFTLTVKQSRHLVDSEALIQKTVVTDNSSQVVFLLKPDDTRQLIQGSYDYDIQVADSSNEAVFTPFMGKLRIKQGVTQG